MRVFWFVPALLLPACGGELVPLTGCDPLDKTLCALPFPSSYFLAELEAYQLYPALELQEMSHSMRTYSVILVLVFVKSRRTASCT